MFLSANNFFWRIDVRRGVMTRVATWRSLGRPEAPSLGAQYIGNGHGIRGSWLRPEGSAEMALRRHPARPRGAFSSGGIEIDAVAPSSPRGTRIVAAIPNLLGRGKSAHMTYYETPRGAKVFSAGAFTLAGSVRQPAVRQLLTNLWNRLARTVETPSGLRSVTAAQVRPAAPPGALRGLANTLQQYPRLRLASPFERAEAKRLLDRDGARGEGVARSTRGRARGLQHAPTEARARVRRA